MSESHEESRQIQIREAHAAQIEKITTLHDQCCDDSALKTAVLAKINRGRECGLELIELGKRLKGGFKSMFKRTGVTDYTFPFSYETAAIYMRFARANPQPITELADGIACLKDALIASGALSAPSGHGSQALHLHDFLGGITKKLFDFRAFWGDELKKVPIEQWDENRKETARDEFRWFAEKYVELGGTL